MTLLHSPDLPADRLEVDMLGVFFFEDEVPPRGPAAFLDWRLNGQLTSLLLQQQVSGRRGERLVVRSNPKFTASWLLFYGGGRWEGLSREGYRRLLSDILETCREAGMVRIGLALRPLHGWDHPVLEELVATVAADMDNAPESLLLSVGPEEPRWAADER